MLQFRVSPNLLSILLIQAAALVAAALAMNALGGIFPFLPGPTHIVEEGAQLLIRPDILQGFGVTLLEASFGLLIAAGIGISLGLVIGSSAALVSFANPLILALYSVPKIVFLPILMLIFGTGMGPKIANAAVHAAFPILLNTLVATRETTVRHEKLGQSLCMTRLQFATKILLPGIVPPVFGAIRLGVGLSFMGALLAELFQSEAGVGHLVHDLYNSGNIAGMLAIILAVLVIIVSLNGIMAAVESRFSRWREI